MVIRHATKFDIKEMAEIEAKSYPQAEGASIQSITKRVEVFPECFWILEDNNRILAFINGMVTN